MTPIRLAAALCVCTLLLTACSMPKLVYGQADWLLLRQVDGYLDLDEIQSTQLGEAIAVAMRRHRSEELPAIAATLRSFAAHARDGLEHADVRVGIERARALALRSAELGIAPLSAALADLAPRQRAHLTERFEERNERYRERHALDAPHEERLERRAQRTVKRIEDWTGPLLPEQQALVREIRATMPDSAAHWLAYMQARQRALLALLDGGGSAHEIATLLGDAWLRQQNLPPVLAANRTRQIDALVDLLVRLDATLDSTQRAHLVSRLESYARDADTLARKA